MPGRIRDDSIAEVRERARIDEVISSYVTLSKAGGGQLKGLCPFHDEKSPSFNVTPSRGFFHCLAGETRVLTDRGAVPIRELAGGVHRILGSRGDWIEAPFRSFGVQPLMRIVATRNRQRKELYATDGHRWFVRSGKKQDKSREVLTADLKAGQRLVSMAPIRNVPELAGTRALVIGRSGPSRSALEQTPATGDRPDWVVESVEPTDRVEEVFCAEVEDGHAFTLEDNILTGNCFGCQEGGDVLTFLMKIDGLSFAEAVERLAERYNVELKREDDGGRGREERPKGPQRRRLVEANAAAQQFYAEHLSSPEAQPGRKYLSDRGFDRDVAEHYGMGFAPKEGDALFKHLRGRGFTQEETVAAGLVAIGRGPYDRFRGRLLWPIREAGGETIGFGARRVMDDDRIEAKFLNTPETPLYKKSQVLYGIDLARREIGNLKQAVVVEGYTDVMACHLSGVGTAVASCGTAFGDDHTRVLRRFLMDHEEFRGEVIFTFDGDAAGQKAALRTFSGDQKFVAQTYVAVQPDGLDPCDVRVQHGDAAVRELVASREPLYRFVLRNVVDAHDLDRADGRVAAVREAAALVVSSRDSAVARSSFARDIAALTGVDPVDVQAEVERAARRPASARTPDVARDRAADRAPDAAAPAKASGPPVPDPRDPRFAIERETLKLVVQHPMAIGRTTADIGANDFAHPGYRAVWSLVEAAGGTVAGEGDAGWATKLRDAATEPATSSLVSALAVEPLLTAKEPDASYVAHHVFRLLELTTLRRIAEVKAKLQRTNPVQQPADYNRMFGELAALEQHRRVLRDHVVGTE